MTIGSQFVAPALKLAFIAGIGFMSCRKTSAGAYQVAMITGIDSTMTSRPASMTPPSAMPKPATLPVTTPPSTPPLTSRKAKKAMPKIPPAKITPTITRSPAR